MKTKLSILIYSMSNGGAEKVVSILLDELNEKFDITLILMNNTIFYDVPKKIKISYLEKSNPLESGLYKFFKLPLLAFRYKHICLKNDIKVSLSFMNRPNYINIIAKLFGSKTKTIISERAMPSIQHSFGLQGIINRFLIKHLYKYADIVTANSFGNTIDLKNNFFIDNVMTINNHFDVKKIQLFAKEICGFRDNKFTFITIGRLDSGKNHQLIIDVMNDIDAKLYIIGEGVLREKLELQIKKNKLEKKVFLLGKQINPYKYLAKSDCFVFSSNYEGFPNVLVESLICSIPVISTDCKSGPREILAPNSNFNTQLYDSMEVTEYGILTPINNADNLKKSMKLMLSDNSLRYNYKEKSLNIVKKFNKDKIIQQWINIIKDNNE